MYLVIRESLIEQTMVLGVSSWGMLREMVVKKISVRERRTTATEALWAEY